MRIETLTRLPVGAECAEIGVWKGDFTAEILRITKPATLHLIDPWKFSAEYTPYHAADRPDELGDRIAASVAERFRDSPVVRIHRMASAEYLRSVAEASLDWIYVDGDHNESAVMEDLRLAWRALRTPGWLAGDDYYWRDAAGRLSVKSAVDAFCKEFALSRSLIGGQFIIQKR